MSGGREGERGGGMERAGWIIGYTKGLSTREAEERACNSAYACRDRLVVTKNRTKWVDGWQRQLTSSCRNSRFWPIFEDALEKGRVLFFSNH